MISLERQILYAGRLYQMLAYGDKPPSNGRGQSRDQFFKIISL